MLQLINSVKFLHMINVLAWELNNSVSKLVLLTKHARLYMWLQEKPLWPKVNSLALDIVHPSTKDKTMWESMLTTEVSILKNSLKLKKNKMLLMPSKKLQLWSKNFKSKLWENNSKNNKKLVEQLPFLFCFEN